MNKSTFLRYDVLVVRRNDGGGKTLREYRDSGFERPVKPVWLTDKEIERAGRKYPKVCADVVIVSRTGEGLIYLAKRCIQPMPDWWVIGGGVNFGEPLQEAAARHFKADTGLDLPLERFKLMYGGVPNRYLWDRRHQKPQDVGEDALAFTFSVVLTREERESIVLSPAEYNTSAGLRSFTRKELYEYEVHQAVIDLYDELFEP